MPVNRCPLCHRGRAGYLDGEKSLLDLTLSEIQTEIPKYEAKSIRIRNHVSDLRNGVTQVDISPEGRACPECGHGWREFQNHRKDLWQLTVEEAQAALRANQRWLGELREREGELTAQNPAVWLKQQMAEDDDDD